MNELFFTVTALSPIRILNNAKRAEINLKSVKYANGKVTLWVPEKDKEAFVAILDDLCYTYEVTAKRGVKNAFLAWLTRFGLLGGVLAVVLLLVVSSLYVTEIRIDGLENTIEVRKLLEKNGIAGAVLKSKIDTDAIERLIAENIENAGFSSVTISGMRLKVQIYEMLPAEETEDGANKKLITGKDAVITRIYVHHGTALVKPGQAVRAGEELIGGYYAYADGQTFETAPAGEVYGKVYYTVRVPVFAEIDEYTRMKMAAEAREQLFVKIPAGAKYLDSWTREVTVDGLTAIEFTAEVEERIDTLWAK